MVILHSHKIKTHDYMMIGGAFTIYVDVDKYTLNISVQQFFATFVLIGRRSISACFVFRHPFNDMMTSFDSN